MGRQVFFPFLMTRHSLGSMRQRSRPLKAEARRQPHLEGRLVVLQLEGSWVRGNLMEGGEEMASAFLFFLKSFLSSPSGT